MVYTDPDDVPWSAYLAVAAILTIIVAALLPWYEAVGDATTGFGHSDGYVSAGVALAALAFLVVFEWNLVARLGAALAGAITISIGFNAWDQVSGYSTHDPRYGLYLTLLGGGVLVVAAIWGTVEARRLDGESADDAPGAEDSPDRATATEDAS